MCAMTHWEFLRLEAHIKIQWHTPLYLLVRHHLCWRNRIGPLQTEFSHQVLPITKILVWIQNTTWMVHNKRLFLPWHYMKLACFQISIYFMNINSSQFVHLVIEDGPISVFLSCHILVEWHWVQLEKILVQLFVMVEVQRNLCQGQLNLFFKVKWCAF